MKPFVRSAVIGLIGFCIIGPGLTAVGLAGNNSTDAPPPPPTTRTDQMGDEYIEEVGLTIRPPEEEYSVVGEDQARDKAWLEGGDWASKSATIKLVSIEAPFFAIEKPISAWIVTYNDVCIPFYGSAEWQDRHPESTCASTTDHVVIDASTGEFLFQYSY